MPGTELIEALCDNDRNYGSVRWHELALRRWLHANFVHQQGFPIPVVFSTPMDAWAQFHQLWKRPNNPYAYLLDLKDAKGAPRYLPHPHPPRYPLISVDRKSWRPRLNQSFGTKRYRRIGWPSVDDENSSITKEELGNVATLDMPTAWDFRFQLDFLCLRPDTMSRFVDTWQRAFAATSAGSVQTWIPIAFPGFMGTKLCRMYVEGDLEDASAEEPQAETQLEFRISANVVIEGYNVDTTVDMLPALWQLVYSSNVTTPGQVESVFSSVTADLRGDSSNLVFEDRSPLPPEDPDMEPETIVAP